MSDETIKNVNTENITTTEDDFDSFQTSDVKDNEFITLSDIVSDDTPHELLDTSFTEIVLDGNEIPPVCSTSTISLPNEHDISSTENTHGNEFSTGKTIQTPKKSRKLSNKSRGSKKRGRQPKQKNTFSNPPSTGDKFDTISNVTSTTSIPNEIEEIKEVASNNISKDISTEGKSESINDTSTNNSSRPKRTRRPVQKSLYSPPSASKLDFNTKAKNGKKSRQASNNASDISGLEDTLLSSHKKPALHGDKLAQKRRGRPPKQKPNTSVIESNTHDSSSTLDKEKYSLSTTTEVDDTKTKLLQKSNEQIKYKKTDYESDKEAQPLQQIQPNECLNKDIGESDDDESDIALSSLKKTLHSDSSDINVSEKCKATSDIPENPQDNEQDVSSTVISETVHVVVEMDLKNLDPQPYDITETATKVTDTASLLVEDTSKRPQRRKTKRTYEFESDEDPFANMASSDESDHGDIRRKKAKKFFLDSEYVPNDWDKKYSSADDSALEDFETEKPRKKRGRKKSDVGSNKKSPVKRGKNRSIETDKQDSETKDTQSISVSDDSEAKPKPSQFGLHNKEFENFLAQRMKSSEIEIKKTTETKVTPLDIPTIDINETKKYIETSTQTNKVDTNSVSAQTSSTLGIKLKETVALSADQTDNACLFLKNILKTTSELGQLMTEKSEEFIDKKINSSYVKDTSKIDYCINKAFLLFKLAKDNLSTMEETLETQYEEFLKQNNLSASVVIDKKIVPKAVETNSDSDCEIVEVNKPEKPKFNPKTVFLNKELSIKIAKKPSSAPVVPDNKNKKQINIKGKNAVWINNTVMVKKVKSQSQSFLAQDGRNKKPPDSVSLEMVNKFFREYEKKQQVLDICKLYTSPQWLHLENRMLTGINCYYFIMSKDDCTHNCNVEALPLNNNTEEEYINRNVIQSDELCIKTKRASPQKLLELCINLINDCVNKQNKCYTKTQSQLTEKTYINSSFSLKKLCIEKLGVILQLETNNKKAYNDGTTSEKVHAVTQTAKPVLSLQNTCLRKLYTLLQLETGNRKEFNDSNMFNKVNVETHYAKQVLSLQTTCLRKLHTLLQSEPINRVSLNGMCTKSEIKNDSFLKQKQNKNFQPVQLLQLQPVPTLQKLCFKILCKILQLQQDNNRFCNDENNDTEILYINKVEELKINSVLALQKLCVGKLQENYHNIHSSDNFITPTITNKQPLTLLKLSLNILQKTISLNESKNNKILYSPFSLKRITWKKINNVMFSCGVNYSSHKPDSLKKIVIKAIHKQMFELIEESSETLLQDIEIEVENEGVLLNTLTIENVNTVSEDIFMNINDDDNSNDSFPDGNGDDDYYDSDPERSNENDNWVSKVQLQDLKTCLLNKDKEVDNVLRQGEPIVTIPAKIKQEIIEEAIDPEINVKLEPFDPDLDSHDGNETIKKEVIEDNDISHQPNKNMPVRTNSIDEEIFEEFVRSNKMIRALVGCEYTDESAFSQSSHRIRRQHEPDSDDENHGDMSLLVPCYLNSTQAKNTLMESSSGEETNPTDNTSKQLDKRKRGRPKKGANKNKNIAPNSATKPETTPTKLNQPQSKGSEETLIKPQGDEISNLTKRLKNRIRNEEKKEESLNQEVEDSLLTCQKPKKSLRSNTVIDDQIQCNAVDSTEKIGDEDTQNSMNSSKPKRLTRQQKILQTPLVENETMSNTTEDRVVSPVMMSNEPAENLQCEPALPQFDIIKEKEQKPTQNMKLEDPILDNIKKECIETDDKQIEEHRTITNDSVNFTERHGWKCYQIDFNDNKLCQVPHIPLDKLPEEFVETYFRFQEINTKKNEDVEIDRLTNLQSLHKPSSNKDTFKERRFDSSKEKPKKTEEDDILGDPDISDHYEEFEPSDEELGLLNDDDSLLIETESSKPASENNIAKSSLMDDQSETETDPELEENLKKVVKLEPGTELVKKPEIKYKPGPKSKKKQLICVESKDLVLTADKVMKKDIELLHAPVTLDETPKETKSSTSDRPRKAKDTLKRYSSNTSKQSRSEDDSSSEEEKQWFTTKEKLLKRLEKKAMESTSVDDAKRVKLVNEFIEKRVDAITASIKKRGRRYTRGKKYLEKQKQLKILSMELFGDSAQHTTKKSATWKGRRNIRKVIDKKSLARSTVIANMEECERKRRLSIKQTKLRELLGYEEGINVLVINDAVCLEYDFQLLQPIVSVHPFFTKVMKTHQYEGVKFMWDACFESLDQVEAGQPGGGCILAHCMGLGKTLQVLALLHTVLTHPRAAMKRVLVCCPLSTVLNWVDEIHKWLGPVTNKIKVFELSKLKKTYERAYQLEDWFSGGGIFIIGYELFRSLSTLDPIFDNIRPTIVNKIRMALLDPGPDIVVCDEGHLLKNDSSVLAMAMSRVKTKRRIILTGTPMQNNLREYYCMVNFVKPNLLGTYSEYSNRFENPIMNGQHRDSQEADIKLMKGRTHILHKVLEGCLQRQEASVLYPYLPKKYEYTVFISLTTCQADMYEHYLSTCLTTKQNLLKNYNILQKVWSHPQVLHNFSIRKREGEEKIKVEKLEDDLAQEDLTATVDTKPGETDIWWLQHLDGGNMLDSLESSNKFVTVFKILNESVERNDKLLIFSTSLYTMDSLEYFLKKINNWSLGQEYYRLDGSVPPEVRQKWCREFNAENNHKTKLFLISTRAGSLGLNMTAANRVIILDTSWNPAHDIQSIFRVYRFGQKKDCYIYRLVSLGTMEQKIYERSVTKQAVSCRVVDEQQIDRHYNMAELTELYSFSRSGAGVQMGVAAGVRDVALLRVARDLPALHAVHEHDSLLRDTRDTLTEHERAAAWLQFQEEQRDTQIKQESSTKKVYTKKNQEKEKVVIPTEVKSEDIPILKFEVEDVKDPEYTPQHDTKPKRGRKSSILQTSQSTITSDIAPSVTPTINSNITVVTDSTSTPNTMNIAKQLTEAIRLYNTNNDNGTLNPEEIAKLVSSVISQASTNNKSVTTENAQVIDNTAAINEISSFITKKRGKRGRPRKNEFIAHISQEKPNHVKPQTSLLKPTRSSRRTKLLEPENVHEIIVPEVVEQPIQPKINLENKKQDEIITLEFEEPISHKRKRKSAAAAEKIIFENQGSPVVDINDDDFVAPVPSTSGTNTIKKYKKTLKNDLTALKSDTNKPKDIKPPVSKNMTEESIVLSDEEIIPDKEIIPDIEIKQLKTKNSTKVPLHTSLLTNKNFIRIVAHAYLKGNPALDEDAAFLAAEYSTSKAFKEVESTGKQINSGPIYDIALQVLGMSVLQKLHESESVTDKQTTSTNKSTSETQDKQVIQKAEATKETASYKPGPKSKKSNEKPPKENKQKPKISVRSEVEINSINNSEPREVKKDIPTPTLRGVTLHPFNTNSFKVTASSSNVFKLNTAPAYVTSNDGVVPVGLIQRANMRPENLPSSIGECILPDDDVHIISDLPTVTKDTQETITSDIAPEPIKTKETNTNPSNKPKILKLSMADIENAIAVMKKPVEVIQKPIQTTSATIDDNTINLDTDDEDDIPLAATKSAANISNSSKSELSKAVFTESRIISKDTTATLNTATSVQAEPLKLNVSNLIVPTATTSKETPQGTPIKMFKIINVPPASQPKKVPSVVKVKQDPPKILNFHQNYLNTEPTSLDDVMIVSNDEKLAYKLQRIPTTADVVKVDETPDKTKSDAMNNVVVVADEVTPILPKKTIPKAPIDNNNIDLTGTNSPESLFKNVVLIQASEERVKTSREVKKYDVQRKVTQEKLPIAATPIKEVSKTKESSKRKTPLKINPNAPMNLIGTFDLTDTDTVIEPVVQKLSTSSDKKSVTPSSQFFLTKHTYSNKSSSSSSSSTKSSKSESLKFNLKKPEAFTSSPKSSNSETSLKSTTPLKSLLQPKTTSVSKSSSVFKSSFSSSNVTIKPSAKLSASTVVGKSKEIVIGGGDNSKLLTKLTSTTSNSPNNRIVHITHMQTISPNSNASTSDGKRKSTSAPSTSDAKKLKVPKTLEDFSIDDFEDIIELE